MQSSISTSRSGWRIIHHWALLNWGMKSFEALGFGELAISIGGKSYIISATPIID
ncbi:hypothetical protein [Chamaesiphon sp. OTE_20_metabat_361]|uniref:hypothetical protein n=1 Tax=Chamaesiphon sp. OTE_20_metabat_361 TaxID=2964689 RepID=UPI00286A883D|nr:hypothetical protein [Chamaesiphon sp. OTE_20_metabat_361]